MSDSVGIRKQKSGVSDHSSETPLMNGSAYLLLVIGAAWGAGWLAAGREVLVNTVV
jgi:hypothetical protein